MCGKGAADGASNLIPMTTKNALKNEELLDPTTRELVIFNARRRPAPAIPGPDKPGWWAADEYVFVHYDTKLFTASRVPTAKGFNGSSEMHALYGRATDERVARDGALTVRGTYCPCAPCREHNFARGACLLEKQLGPYAKVVAPIEVMRDPRVTRTQELGEFAATLKADMVRRRPAPYFNLSNLLSN